MGTRVNADPVCALQELCLSRKWTLPKYEYYIKSFYPVFMYSIQCTVKTWTVRVDGQLKKTTKQRVAKVMYRKVKNVTDSKEFSLKEESKKCVPENKFEANGILADSCEGASAGLNEQPVIAVAVDSDTRVAAEVQVVHKNNEPAIIFEDNTVNDGKKQCVDNEVNKHNFGPVVALQALCMSRKLALPKYKVYKKSDTIHCMYYVECTVKTWTVGVEGLIKKEVKQQAALIMFLKIKNITDSKEFSLNEESKKCVPENKFEVNGILTDSCVDVSARPNEQLAIAAVVDNDTQKAAKVQVAHKNNDPSTIFEDVTQLERRKECIIIGVIRHFQLGPIYTLQALCMYWKWASPKYKGFLKHDTTHNTYIVDCTVHTWTVRAKGLIKKRVKRRAASIMCDKILRFCTCTNKIL